MYKMNYICNNIIQNVNYYIKKDICLQNKYRVFMINVHRDNDYFITCREN